MSYRNDVPHRDFAAGYEAGYRSIRGTLVGMPGIPGHTGVLANTTQFLSGIRKGIEAATGKDWEDMIED